MVKTMVVKKIDGECCSKCFYGDSNYHVIIDRDSKQSIDDAKLICIGDTIEYETYGNDFGFLLKRLNT